MKISSQSLLLLLSTYSTKQTIAFTTHTPPPKPKTRLYLLSLPEFLSTTFLVASVGYTQRLAGQSDFKQIMATKISRGEITPQQLVDEIVLMSDEINMAAEEAERAQVEVERLLAETREVLQLPSGDESSLVEFSLDEKEMVSIVRDVEEVHVSIGIDESVENVQTAEVPAFAMATDSEGLVSMGLDEDAENAQDVQLPAFAIAKESSADDMLEIMEQTKFAIMQDELKESNKKAHNNELDPAVYDIAPSERQQHAGKQNSFETIAENIIHNIDDSFDFDHDDAEAIADALLATPPSIRNLNEVDAYNLAREALASASVGTDSLHAGNEEFIPAPPDEEPSINLVKEGIEIEAKSNQAVIIDKHHKAKKENNSSIRSSPLARLLCTELGVELSDVPGTGLKGRVVADDVRKYAAALQVS